MWELDKGDEAAVIFRKALAVDPELADAHSHLAIILNSVGRRSEALEHYRKDLQLKRGDNPINPQDRSFHFISKAKISHDIEQFRYLASEEHENEKFVELASLYEGIENEIDWPGDAGTSVPLSEEHRERLGNTYNRPFHLVEAPEVTGSTLNKSLDVEKITTDYFSHSAGMTYFDDLLSPDALTSLRRFLLGSTIWFDFKYQGGYLGAMLNDGLACPLLLQIADDMRLTFPAIFKDHKLTHLWAYKYDSYLTGIEVHADFAAVNVNFWITPDSANLSPTSGGLVVHDVEAPLDWKFNSYNSDFEGIQKFLREHDSGKTVVPYRGNRIVLFNSNLFHETDTIEFRPGYENRRINITLLFGMR